MTYQRPYRKVLQTAKSLKMDEKETTSTVLLHDGKSNPDFFNRIEYEKIFMLHRNELELSG